MTALRVLILEDDVFDARLIVNSLRQAKLDIQWERVDSEADYVNRLSTPYDIILSDYSLPQFNALMALKLLRERNLDIPFIIISGSIGEDIAVMALQQGAADYLLKDRLGRLGESVKHALEQRRLREESRRTAAALQERTRATHLTADVGVALTASNTLRDILQTCTESMVRNLDAAFARVWTLNEAENVLELQASAGMYTHIDGSHARVPVGQFKIGLIALEKTPHLTNDVLNDPRVSDHAWAEREGMVAFAGYPLIVEDNLIGVMAMFARQLIKPSILDALASIANLIALGIRRRRADAELRATTERLNHIIASSPAILYTLAVRDDELIPVWVSPNLTDLMGYSVEEALVPEWWTMHVHPDDRARVADRIKRLAERGHITNEYRFRHRNGSYRWIRSEKRLLRDAAGNPAEVIGSWSDIADRKRSERCAEAQHAATRVLAASPSLDDAMVLILKAICETFDWSWGSYWQCASDVPVLRRRETWYPAHERFARFDAATRDMELKQGIGLPGRVWKNRQVEWIPRFAQSDIFVRAANAAQAGLSSGFGVPILRHGDFCGVVEFFDDDIAEPDEELLRVMSDISSQIGQFIDRKQSEEGMQRAQRRLEHVLASSPAVLFTLGIKEGAITGISWISENIKDMLGYSADETHGVEWWASRVHPDDLAVVLEMTPRDLFTHGFVTHQYRFRHHDGNYRWVRAEMRLLRDADNAPLEAVGSWSDITDQKLLEEQFRQAQKMEAVGKLAGGVAHDFNNLLTVIMGYSEIYSMKLRAEDPLRAPLEEIRKAGQRASGLTRQLLAFSRKQMLMPVILNLNEILAEMEKMLRRLIGEDIALTVLLGSHLWQIKADAGQIEQIVMNIVVNARDAMPQGGKLLIETKNVELTPRYRETHREAQIGDFVLLAISDNGSGMTADVRARIFEPFFTTKGPTKGTGLGLATVFGIVKQTGGHIEVYSEVGQGTTFKIYLPRDHSGSPSASVPRQKEPVRGGGETILLVEDEEGVRNLAMTVLKDLGYVVLEARHGGDALLICETSNQPVDLMITDVVMPHLSGRQLAERLAVRQPKMKVLFMSGYTDDAIVHHGVLESGVPFLQKPFAPEALARKVREVLDAKSK